MKIQEEMRGKGEIGGKKEKQNGVEQREMLVMALHNYQLSRAV